MKATLSALAIGVVALSATANAQDAKTVKIAYSVDVLDDTQNAVLQAMKKRVDELNGVGTRAVRNRTLRSNETGTMP